MAQNSFVTQGGSTTAPQALRTAELLRTLFEATAMETGEDFFRALVRELADALQVRQTFVSEFIDGKERARTLAVCFDGQFMDNVQFSVRNTPCERVFQGQIHVIREGLQDCYPGEGFAGMRAESYLGVPLVSRPGEVLGHVVALNDKPLPEGPHDLSGLRSFAARATAELERRRAEKELDVVQMRLAAAERLAVLGRLAAGITHEINTPVGVVASSADVTIRSLQHFERLSGGAIRGEPALDLRFKETIHTVRNCAVLSQNASRRIADVVSSLKRLATLDEDSFVEYDLREGLETALTLVKPYLKTGVSIVRELAEVPRILARPAALNQVFVTLLKNAIESIEAQGSITVSTIARDQEVCVTVTDDGRGIPSEQLSTLFDIGFGVKKSRVGMRFGLANALDIVRSHGGDIKVRSGQTQGTEFRVTLPCSAVE